MTIPGEFTDGYILTGADMNLLPAGNRSRVTLSSSQGGFASTPTMPTGFEAPAFTAIAGRLYRITLNAMITQVTSGGVATVFFGKAGAVWRYAWQDTLAASQTNVVNGSAFDVPGAGSVTYSVLMSTSAGTLTHVGATSAGLLLVEEIGPS